MSKELMREESIRMIKPWASFYKDIIGKTQTNTLAAFNFVFPGASTAIIDALTLVNLLSSESWLTALEKYRNKMLEYAPKAVDLARPALIWQIRLANPVLR